MTTGDRDFPDFAAAVDGAMMEAVNRLDDLAGLGAVVELEADPPGDAILFSEVHYRRPPMPDARLAEWSATVWKASLRMERIFGDGMTEWGDLFGTALGVRVRAADFDAAVAAVAAAIRDRVARLTRELPPGAVLDVDWICPEAWAARLADRPRDR